MVCFVVNNQGKYSINGILLELEYFWYIELKIDVDQNVGGQADICVKCVCVLGYYSQQESCKNGAVKY